MNQSLRRLSVVLACSTALLMIAPFASAQRVSNTTQIPTTCTFPASLPPDFRVFAGGGYQGRPEWQPGRSTQVVFDVLVHQPGSPVVLMLGGYESAEWRIKWSEQTRIVGVYLSGYYRQSLRGLSPGVPRVTHTWEGKSNCPIFHLVAGEQPTGLNEVSRAVFGRPVERVFFAEGGVVKIGTAASSARFITDSSSAAELIGMEAIEAAVAAGDLRPATWADVDAWETEAAYMQPGRLHSRQEGRAIRAAAPVRTFLILRPMTLPVDLYGANAATFYVAKGVPSPAGDQGGARIYDLNKLKCMRPGGCQ